MRREELVAITAAMDFLREAERLLREGGLADEAILAAVAHKLAHDKVMAAA